MTANDAYKRAGVDIDAGNRLVDAIKSPAQATSRPGVLGGLGGFGALFDLKAAGFKDPILVSTTDGVGTKLKIAIDSGLHDGIGQDLVAMCVNDLIVQGAQPLFFLDYFATGALDVAIATKVIEGIAKACGSVGCALVGGETAEMPGMYAHGDYDLAGFAVGAAERDGIITGANVCAGDLVLGLASDGIHSNGFSLVRHIIDGSKTDLSAPCPFDPQKSMAQVLMKPTKLYVNQIISALKNNIPLKALSHITGGGLLENIPRTLPKGLGVRLDAKKIPVQPVFKWLQKTGGVDPVSMARTFNCGIGMIIIISADEKERFMTHLQKMDQHVSLLGMVENSVSEHRVILEGWDKIWT